VIEGKRWSGSRHKIGLGRGGRKIPGEGERIANEMLELLEAVTRTYADQRYQSLKTKTRNTGGSPRRQRLMSEKKGAFVGGRVGGAMAKKVGPWASFRGLVGLRASASGGRKKEGEKREIGALL